MLEELKSLWAKLADPEFIPLVLEPVFFYGVGIGLLVFLFAVLFKEGKTQKFGLLIIILSCLAVIPYTHYLGANADTDSGVGADSTQATTMAATDLHGQYSRWNDTQWFYLGLAALATLTFFLSKGGKAGVWLTILTISAGLAATTLGLWLFLS